MDTSSNETRAIWREPLVQDNSGTYTLTSNYASGSSFPLGITPVIYTATDPSGNTATAAFMIIIQGTEMLL